MKNDYIRRREQSLLHRKSYTFALRIIRLTRYLQEKGEHILCRQVLRSGTAIGALVRESEFAQSGADFINKLYIGLKEANETDFWLNLLKDSQYINEKDFESIEADCNELIALLIASIKTKKFNLNENVET